MKEFAERMVTDAWVSFAWWMINVSLKLFGASRVHKVIFWLSLSFLPSFLVWMKRKTAIYVRFWVYWIQFSFCAFFCFMFLVESCPLELVWEFKQNFDEPAWLMYALWFFFSQVCCHIWHQNLVILFLKKICDLHMLCWWKFCSPPFCIREDIRICWLLRSQSAFNPLI